MVSLEDEICDLFEARSVRPVEGSEQHGCINSGQVYEMNYNDDDTGPRTVFVKRSDHPNARVILDGEAYSLQMIRATDTVRAPKPYGVVNIPNETSCVLVMEHLNGLCRLDRSDEQLADQLAAMHLHNYRCIRQGEKSQSWADRAYNEDDDSGRSVRQFGFERITCCGQLEQTNEWTDDWVRFFACHRLQAQIDRLTSVRGDRDCVEQWSQLSVKLDRLFTNRDGELMHIYPALVHGDLWFGNVGEQVISTELDSPGARQPVIYDPAAFYGHSEYDLAIAHMFGGFSSRFYDAYRKKIRPQFGSEWRLIAYKLFHYLNHWNQFGDQYRSDTLKAFRTLNQHLYADGR